MTWIVAMSLLQWVIIAIQAFVIVEVLRQIGLLRASQGLDSASLFVPGEGLERGSLAPALAGETFLDRRESENWLEDRDKTMLIFLSTHCSTCLDLIPSINRLAHNQNSDFRSVVILSHPESDPSPAFQMAGSLESSIPVLIDTGRKYSDLFAVLRTPAATLVDNGIVRVHGIPNTYDHPLALAREEVTIGPESLTSVPA